MDNSFLLSPSILSADLTCLGEQMHALEAGGADWVHIDVMDGHFVPNLSMGPLVAAACRRATSLPLDVHLMVANPDSLLESFVSAGAAWITVHAETCPHLHRTLGAIRAMGCKAGVALNPATSPDVLEWVLPLVDMVLVLGTNPGFSGQQYIPAMTAKVRQIKEMLASYPDTLIQVDGGMTTATLPEVYRAGARVFVAGNAVFKHPEGIAKGIATLRGCI